MIHPTAIVHPGARLDPTVEVGPFTVIDEHVSIGPHCVIGPNVHLTGHTTIGSHNRFHAGCVIGDAPQDLKYRGEPTRVRIGDHNTIREHATVHRSNNLSEDTVIGSHTMLMAGSHIGHNVVVGNHVLVSNGVLLAGHITVGDRAIISGNGIAHQFTRIGTLSLMQGGAGIVQDLPPFCVAAGPNGLCGLNVIGLRRNGFTSEQRMELKRLYRDLFLSGQNLRAAVEQARKKYSSPAAVSVLDFIAATKRGVCRHVFRRSGAPEAE